MLLALLFAADTLTRPFGALPSGVTDGYTTTVRGERFSYISAHPTAHGSLLVRSLDSTAGARWMTAPVVAAPEGGCDVEFLAAVDVTDPGQAPVRFWFTVNGAHPFAVPQPTTTAAQWSVDGGDGITLRFRRLMVDKNGDVHGLFTVHLPAAIAPPGRPVEFGVHGESVGRHSWFILYTVSLQPTVSAHAEQMLARGASGLQQTVRLDIWHPFDTTTVVISADGVTRDSELIAAGASTVRLPVPAVTAPTTVALAIRSSGAAARFDALPLAPVVPREIWLINHDHLDIGYTDSQPAVRRKHERALDSAVAYVDRSRSNAPGDRFEWNEEGLWPLEEYLPIRPADDTARLLAAVRRGDMALSALYANLMTGLSGGEELIHLLDYARSLRHVRHVPVTMAMTSDVPGLTWGMVPALAHQGIRYLSSGPNESDRIGYTLQAWGDHPFWWIGPDARDSVLVMVAGRGYSWVFGWPAGRLTVKDANVMSEYLDTLVAHRYPWDIVQVRVAVAGDNGMPDGQLASEVREWNARFVSPRLVIGTLPQMFAEMARRHGAQLPRIRGDLTGYWEDGAVSTLREEVTARASVERLLQATTLAVLRGVALPDSARTAAWRDLLLWDEHTWGADRSISDPDAPLTVAEWEYKRHFALAADSASRALMDQATRARADAAAIDLWNTHAAAWSGLVTLPDSLSRDVAAVRDARGRVLVSQRLVDGALAVRASLAPMAAIRITLSTPAASRAIAARVAVPARAAGDSLWNDQIAVHIDHRTGAISSARWRGRELVDRSRGGWARYRYVAGHDTAQAQDATGAHIAVVDSGPLVATLRVTASAPGARSLVRDITLDAGSAAITVTTHLDKLGMRDKEAVHLGFPLAVPGGTVRMEQAWAVVRPDRDQAVGANRNFYPVQQWLDASNADFGVTVITPDLPLWELNGLTAQAFEQPDGDGRWLQQALPGTELIAYVMNNDWHTNFKADQPGPVTFRVTLVPHGPFDAVAATRAALAVTEPPVPVPAGRGTVPMPAFAISADSVIVSSVAAAADGAGWIARLWNPGERTGSVEVRSSHGLALREWISSPAEERGRRMPGRITVPAHAVMTIRIQR